MRLWSKITGVTYDVRSDLNPHVSHVLTIVLHALQQNWVIETFYRIPRQYLTYKLYYNYILICQKYHYPMF